MIIKKNKLSELSSSLILFFLIIIYLILMQHVSTIFLSYHFLRLEANFNFSVTHIWLYFIMYLIKSHQFVRNCLIFQKYF